MATPLTLLCRNAVRILDALGMYVIIIIIASHEDEMNDKYNDKLCTSNEVISEMSEEI